MTDTPKAKKKATAPKAVPATVTPIEKPKNVIRATLLGQEWEVPADTVDDFELLDDLAALQHDNDVTRIPSALRRLLGPEEYKRALDALRDESGKVRIEPAADFMMGLIGALNPNS